MHKPLEKSYSMDVFGGVLVLRTLKVDGFPRSTRPTKSPPTCHQDSDAGLVSPKPSRRDFRQHADTRNGAMGRKDRQGSKTAAAVDPF